MHSGFQFDWRAYSLVSAATAESSCVETMDSRTEAREGSAEQGSKVKRGRVGGGIGGGAVLCTSEQYHVMRVIRNKLQTFTRTTEKCQ